MPRDRVHVIGIDPGKHVGVAHYAQQNTTTLWSSLVVDPADLIALLSDWIEEDGPAIIAIERYIVGTRTVRKTRQTDAQEQIGAVKTFAGDRELICDEQSSSDAKRMGNKQVLKMLGWYKTGVELDHANDASSHLFLCIARHHPEVINSLIA